MTTLPRPRRTLRRHRLTRTSTLGAALLLTLAACGTDSPDPDASPSEPSASVTPGPASTTTAAAPASEADSSSASATPGGPTSGSPTDDGAYVPASEKGPARNVPKPVMPDAVKEDTPEGAEAAVEYWWDAVYYLQQTNDPEPLKAVSTQDCDLCDALINDVNTLHSKGSWQVGGRATVDSILSQELEGGTVSTILLSTESGEIFEAPNKPISDSKLTEKSKEPWRSLSVFDESSGVWQVDVMEFYSNG